MAEGDNQKTAAEIAAELQALTDKKKLTEEIKKLTEEQLKVLKEHSTLSEEIRARLEQELATREKTTSYLLKQVEESRRYLENVQKLGQGLDENNLKREASLRFHRDQIRYYEDAILKGAENSQELLKQVKAQKEIVRSLEQQASASSSPWQDPTQLL